MAKTIWKGSISLGLLNIPVELFTAVRAHAIGFKLLHAKCHTPIRNKRWCDTCNREVAWDETIKALPLENKNGKESYFLITPEALKKLRPEKTDVIEIIEFLDRDTIPTVYYDHHYYAGPSGKASEKAFVLFVAALEKVKKIALGRFVMRDKEYVVAIEPYKKILLITTLNYSYEVIDINSIDVLKQEKGHLEAVKSTGQEMEVAQKLISLQTAKKFDISEYRDSFLEKLKEKIREEAKGHGAKKRIATEKKPKVAKEEHPSLLKVLQASMPKKRK